MFRLSGCKGTKKVQEFKGKTAQKSRFASQKSVFYDLLRKITLYSTYI
jgi:hypothetical protein